MIARLASGIAAISLLLSAGAHLADAKPITIERIVAKINEEIITLSELQDFVKGENKKIRGEFTGKELESRLREMELAALDLLIEKKLILQRAKDIDVSVREKELQTAIQVVLDRNRIQADQLGSFLAAEGKSLDSFREKMRQSILIRKVEGREVNFRLSVSEQEIADFYQANIEQFRKGEARRIRQIFFPVPQKASKDEDEEQRAKASAAFKRVKRNGKDFASIAKKISEGPASARGGDLGFIKKGELFPEFEKIIFSMPVGKTGEVIRTRAGYHILLVESKRPGKVTTLDLISGKIRGRLFREKRAKRRREWISELKRAAFLEIDFNPQANRTEKKESFASLFRDVREQISFKLIAVQLLKSSDVIGREKLFWTYGSSRRDERWKSEKLKVDDKLFLGIDDIEGLQSIHREFVNPDPATNLYIYEHNYLLPNSYLGKVSFADLIKEFSLSPKKKKIGLVTDEDRVRLEFEVRVEKTRSIVADPKEIK